MTKQVYSVELAEGGTAVVHPGDPAHSVCDQLSAKGFTSIVMPLASLMSGRPAWSVIEPIRLDIERMLATEQQMGVLMVTDPAIPCVHHWAIETPNPALDYLEGTCKLCTEYKQWPKDPTSAVALSGTQRREQKMYMDEWRARFRSTLEVLETAA